MAERSVTLIVRNLEYLYLMIPFCGAAVEYATWGMKPCKISISICGIMEIPIYRDNLTKSLFRWY